MIGNIHLFKIAYKRFTFLLHFAQRGVILPFKVFPITELGEKGGQATHEEFALW